MLSNHCKGDHLIESLVRFRKDIHANPEFAYDEHRTAGKIIEVLEKQNVDISALSSEECLAFLDDFLSVCQWVSVYYLWRPNLRDEADNHLIELAVAGGAECIVTGNMGDFKQTAFYWLHHLHTYPSTARSKRQPICLNAQSLCIAPFMARSIGSHAVTMFGS